MKGDMQKIKNTLVCDFKEWKKSIHESVKFVSYATGRDINSLWVETFKLLEKSAKCRLRVRVVNLQRRNPGVVYYNDKLMNRYKLTVIKHDVRLQAIYTYIIKEYHVRGLIFMSNHMMKTSQKIQSASN
jgi:hypothetical protein